MPKEKKPVPKPLSAEAQRRGTDFDRAAEDQARFKKWAEKKFSEISKQMLLDFIKIKFNYPDQAPGKNGGQMVFRVEPQNEYHRLNVYTYPSAYNIWQEDDLEELVDVIIHELSHIYTTPLARMAAERFIDQSEIMKECENLTETIAEYIRLNLKRGDNSPYKDLKK